MAFHCTSCGLCCKKIGNMLKREKAIVPWMQPVIDAFPYKAKENGHCEMLKDNQCTVYDNRPLLCNIDKLANEPWLPMNKIDWYSMNYQGCNKLQMEIR